MKSEEVTVLGSMWDFLSFSNVLKVMCHTIFFFKGMFKFSGFYFLKWLFHIFWKKWKKKEKSIHQKTQQFAE